MIDWRFNTRGEDFDIVLFDYSSRTFEIIVDSDLTDDKIVELIFIRIDELIDEFMLHNSLDYSDLIKDFRTKNTEQNGD